jgi:hypothetical protein
MKIDVPRFRATRRRPPRITTAAFFVIIVTPGS